MADATSDQRRDEEGSPEHGTAERYRRGCRCKRCGVLGDAIGIIASRLADMLNGAGFDDIDSARFEEARRVILGHLSRLGPHPGLRSCGTFSKYCDGCRCEACKAVAAKHRNRQAARANSETLATATNHYKQWTGPELETASRTDLTARQVAHMLGRTLKAVKHIRLRLQDDPRYRDTAGVSPGTPRIIGK